MTDASEGDFRGTAARTIGAPAQDDGVRSPWGDRGLTFRRLAIVGIGLMGGSLARAIRARWPDVEIVGVDRPAVIAEARAAGAIDRGVTDAGDAAVAEADLVLLAAPVLQNIASLQAIARQCRDRPLLARPLVTDLGSTKRAIVEAAQSLAAQVVFIGGHPMAGAAQGGFAASRADLFEGRPWILTPDVEQASSTRARPAREPDHTAEPDHVPAPRSHGEGWREALSAVDAFVRSLGAEPVVMSAAEHDRVMAYVSHLPQLVASALMRTIGPQVGAAGLAVSGPGLADATRLASSPSGVWRDICQTNAAPIAAALDALIADLQQARARLATPDALDGWLESWLDEGARWRSQVPNGHRAPTPAAREEEEAVD